MIQIYFLSIALNAGAGFILATDSSGFGDKRFSDLLRPNGPARLCTGILCAVVGVLKLLSPAPGNLPLIGDIIPSIAGIGAGAVLLYDYYRSTASPRAEGDEKAGNFITGNKKVLGAVAILSAVLHFLFPGALLL
jgi:hypothetical protein